jgi:hypothetical protein
MILLVRASSSSSSLLLFMNILLFFLLFLTLFVLGFETRQSNQSALGSGYVNWEEHGSSVVSFLPICPSIRMGKVKVVPYQDSL